MMVVCSWWLQSAWLSSWGVAGALGSGCWCLKNMEYAVFNVCFLAPLYHEILQYNTMILLRPKDHCGKCQIRTQDLCPWVWCATIIPPYLLDVFSLCALQDYTYILFILVFYWQKICKFQFLSCFLNFKI